MRLRVLRWGIILDYLGGGHKGHHPYPQEGEAEGDLTQTEEGKTERKGGGNVTVEAEFAAM